MFFEPHFLHLPLIWNVEMYPCTILLSLNEKICPPQVSVVRGLKLDKKRTVLTKKVRRQNLEKILFGRLILEFQEINHQSLAKYG